AKVGTVVSLDFTASDTNLNPPTAKINGNTATVTPGSGNHYTASYTIQSSDSETAVTYEVDLSDKAGHTVQAASGATGWGTVDKAPARVSSVVLTTGLGSAPNLFAVTGTQITLSFTASDANLSAVTAQINGHSVTANNTGGNSYQAQYTVSGDAD